ncbi:MAG: hypothetical protein EBY44_02115 [Actinobacteria bacterium]|nr:hypothetical protein [Actinomycetota bacterium]
MNQASEAVLTKGFHPLALSNQSEAILAMLLKHLARPDFAFRHRWEEGDVVIWDNRSTQHIAMADFTGRRVVHRVGFVAEPFAA